MFSMLICLTSIFFFFFFNDTATTEIYTLSLHDALPISLLTLGHGRPTVRLEMESPCQNRPSHEPDFGRDRKSTRLNSSHSQISYAVFCLKKKKKTITHTPLTHRLLSSDSVSISLRCTIG